MAPLFILGGIVVALLNGLLTRVCVTFFEPNIPLLLEDHSGAAVANLAGVVAGTWSFGTFALHSLTNMFYTSDLSRDDIYCSSSSSNEQFSLMSNACRHEEYFKVINVCPDGLQQHGRRCYKAFSDLKATWIEAKWYCMGYGGKLAIIDSAEKQKVIENILRSSRGNAFYLGGTDIDRAGSWQWIERDGTPKPVRYRNWARYQPDGGSEHCLEIRKSYGYKWNNEECHYKSGFICEVVLGE